jgi:hypothetical protein
VAIRNRRLVLMPPVRKPRARTKAKAQATLIAPSGLNTWHAFAFLIVTALALYYLKWPKPPNKLVCEIGLSASAARS